MSEASEPRHHEKMWVTPFILLWVLMQAAFGFLFIDFLCKVIH